MTQELTKNAMPHGLTRLAFRLPIWLYRLRLGWLLGDRLLLLTHIGRTSGQRRDRVKAPMPAPFDLLKRMAEFGLV
jgi:hypothetical protein